MFDYSVNFEAVDRISSKINRINQNLDKFTKKVKTSQRSVSKLFNKRFYEVNLKLHTRNAMRKIKELRARMDSLRQRGMMNIRNGFSTMMSGAAILTGKIAIPIAFAKTFETSWKSVAKVINEPAENIAKLREKILAMTSVIPKSAEELAEIAEAGAKLGLTTAQLEKFTEVASKMSIAMDMPTDKVGEDMGKLGSLLKYTTKDFEEFGDRLNHIADNTAANGAKVLNIAKRAAGSFGALDFGKGDVVGLSAVADMLSVSQEVAGTSLDRILVKLREVKKYRDLLTSKKAKGLEEILIGVSKMSKPAQMKWIQKYIAKSGEAMQLTQKMINNVELLKDTLEMANSNKALGSLQREFQSVMSTSNVKIKLMKNAFQRFMIKVGTGLLPLLNKVVEGVTKIIDKMRVWADKHPELTKKIMLVGGALGAIITVLGALGMALGVSQFTFASLLPVIAVLTSPITILIGLLGAMVYYWDDITSYISNFISKMREANPGISDFRIGLELLLEPFRWLIDKAKELGSALYDMLPQSVKTTLDNIATGFDTVVTAVTNFQEKWLNFDLSSDMLKNFGEAINTYLIKPIKTAMEWVQKLIDKFNAITHPLSVSTDITNKRAIAPDVGNIGALEEKVANIKAKIQAMQDGWSSGSGIWNKLFGPQSTYDAQQALLKRAINNLEKAKAKAAEVSAEMRSTEGIAKDSKIMVDVQHKVPTQQLAVKYGIEVHTDAHTTAKVVSTKTSGVTLPNKGNE